MKNHQPANANPMDANPFEWIAFQYLAGELDPQAAESFEAELADNEAAQTALVETVKMIEMTRAAMDQPHEDKIQETRSAYVVSGSSRNSSWNQSNVPKVLLGGLATLFVVSLIGGLSFWMIGSDSPGSNEGGVGVVAETDVANLWANALQDSIDADEVERIAMFESEGDQVTSVVNVLNEDEESTDSESSWLIEAMKEFGDDGSLSPSGNSMIH